jgi:hypothetical protein
MKNVLLVFLGLCVGFSIDDTQQRIARAADNVPIPTIHDMIKLQDSFMIAGSISPSGVGRRLKIDEEGRVICAPQP